MQQHELCCIVILMLPRNTRLDHESVRRPETDILKYHEYIVN